MEHSDEQFINGVKRRLAGHEDLAALPTAVERAASLGCLIRNQLVLTQQICPVGDDMAVARATDRVLRHRKFGGKAAGDTVLFRL